MFVFFFPFLVFDVMLALFQQTSKQKNKKATKRERKATIKERKERKQRKKPRKKESKKDRKTENKKTNRECHFRGKQCFCVLKTRKEKNKAKNTKI